MRTVLVIALATSLAACATTPPAEAPPAEAPAAPDRTCDASGLAAHIGHTASQASGATLLELSGAQTLRWGPPNSVWTMDYRADRLNVRYDGDMKITAITCG
ncbi:MAG: I78 family peptidase inhibitor [Erythrobacter sp.]